VNGSDKNRELIITKTKDSGGLFTVSRISPEKDPKPGTPKDNGKRPVQDIIPLLEDLLTIVERSILANRKIRVDFNTLLKRKFMEKADKYSFLDPFAAEFQYVDAEVTYLGKAGSKELTEGITEVVGELAQELGIKKRLNQELMAWSRKYGKELSEFRISIL